MNETFQFKTNLKCSGCIAALTPHLNELAQIEKWEVDLKDPNRVLTVQSTELTPQQIVQTIQQAGYQAEVLG